MWLEQLQDGYHTGRMKCELCLLVGKILIFFIVQLNNNSISSKKYSIWRYYCDIDTNQKYKFTAPIQLLLTYPREMIWILFCAFLGFGKLKLSTKEIRRKTQFTSVKEKSVT